MQSLARLLIAPSALGSLSAKFIHNTPNIHRSSTLFRFLLLNMTIHVVIPVLSGASGLNEGKGPSKNLHFCSLCR